MNLGNTEIHVVSDGLFRLDGGAMFGVVPKVLWQKLEQPDENNRILMGLSCLLVNRGDEKILIDTGIGDKFDAKFAGIYSIHREQTLIERLAGLGVKPTDITHVIMSHMHFDHIGWNTYRTAAGEIVPTFPNAVYFAQRGEYEVARNPDPRSKASYVSWNWEALEKSGQLHLLDGTGECLPRIQSFITGGHTKFHTIVKIDTGEGLVAFLADLVPTTSHLRTAYVMGYDLYPLEAMQMKPRVLQQAFAERWLLIFEHAPRVNAGYLRSEDGQWRVEPVQLE